MPRFNRYRRTRKFVPRRYPHRIYRRKARYSGYAKGPSRGGIRPRWKSETKFYDSTAAGGGIGQYPVAWSRYDLSCGIIQGTTASTRLGNEIVTRSFGISFMLTRNASGPTVQRVRYMIIDYIDSEGTIPTSAEMFQSTGTFLPQRYLPYMTDFKVLADRVVVLDSAIANGKQVRIRRKYMQKMKYTDNSGTTGGQAHHQLFFLIWSDTASPNPPSITDMAWRINFTDN